MSKRPEGATFVVAPADKGRRLDQVLADHLPELSRRRARVLLDMGGVFVDGRRTKMAGRPMKPGEKVVAHLGSALERATKATGLAARERDEARLPSFSVVHEDEDLVVVDKPAGLLTAPTPESDRNNLAGLLARRRQGHPQPIFVVHRIDLETSGLLVFAKTEEANRDLSEKFRTHDLLREYLAMAAGQFPEGVQTISRPVGGRPAVTHVAIEERLGTRATLVRTRLETGRTHQIRLHFQSLGHPVLGDRQYGTATFFDPPRMALHATRLQLRHPSTGELLKFESPWPSDLADWLEGLRATSRKLV